LPPSLDGYTSIWYIEAYSGLSAEDQARLASYIRAGGSVYLTGERPCCEVLNDGVEAVLHSVLKDQDIRIGGLGDIDGPFTFHPSVTDHVASFPNLLVDFVPDSPGGMAGIVDISSHNVFASNGTTAVGGVWPEGDMQTGQGRVALLMDIDWLDNPERVPIIQNIQNFLDHGKSCSNGSHHDGMLWTGPTDTNGPRNCSTILAPKTVSWTVGSDAGPVTIDVSATGVDVNCDIGAVSGATRADCQIGALTAANASLVVKASDALGQTVRWYRVRPQNDPRNVPVPFSLSSNWWEWPDQDGDGIPTHWEENGVWVKDRYLDLPGQGARWDHKNLFLHYDFEAGEELDEQVFDRMRAVFAQAPLHNPDGVDGVTLHIERGASVPGSVVGDFDLNQNAIQRVTGYSSFAASPQFGGGGVPQIYKWMLNFDQAPSAVGSARLKTSFAWTAYPVDAWVAALSLQDAPGAAVNFAEAVNATHELGHLLGLHHHGSDAHPEYDPSYKSVMTYSYSHFGIPGPLGIGARIDYSRAGPVNLDWRTGEAVGALTFVPGQYGEIPDFYAANNSEQLDLSGQRPVEPAPEEIVRAADPASIQGFVDEFELPASLNSPTIEDATAQVRAGEAVAVQLKATNPLGGVLAFVVDDGGQKGTATPTESGIRYVAGANSSGPDLVKVRALNATFGSAQASVLVTVLARGAAPGTSPASGPIGNLPGSNHSDPCRGLTGQGLRACRVRQRITRRCGTLRGKKRKACAKKVQAEAGCRRVPAKADRGRLEKRKTCKAKAKRRPR
jgi:hypothetical protein